MGKANDKPIRMIDIQEIMGVRLAKLHNRNNKKIIKAYTTTDMANN
jgi:hypothetical protein